MSRIPEIFSIEEKKQERFLRERTEPFSFSSSGDPVFRGVTISRKEFARLIDDMRRAMQQANGIGLAANQIGLPYQLFVARVPVSRGGDYKLYTILNPKFEKTSEEKIEAEEGCLSVPGIYGHVERHARVTLTGFDKRGKPLKIKAWGILARVFQHETDHLNGKLFIDRTKKLHRAITPRELEQK